MLEITNLVRFTLTISLVLSSTEPFLTLGILFMGRPVVCMKMALTHVHVFSWLVSTRGRLATETTTSPMYGNV